MTRRIRNRPRRGLTLIEVLLAVFILGIGVISVASIFPAGIAQQRRSSDDVVGTTIADNALSLLRTRLDSTSFGPPSLLGNQPIPTIPGGLPDDFGWARPGFVWQASATIDGIDVPRGSIVIFNPTPSPIGGVTPSEVPWNSNVHGDSPPPIVITQGERHSPMGATYALDAPPASVQHAWDVMFRRFQGRIQVAIFVYRVGRPGAEPGAYAVQPNPSNPATVPPLPIRVNLAANPNFTNWPAGVDEVPNTAVGAVFDLGDDRFAWQLPGQWILDQNSTIHRVLGGRRRANEGPVRLAQRTPNLGYAQVYTNNVGAPTFVEDIWYIPIKDGAGNSLTPIFLTVRDL